MLAHCLDLNNAVAHGDKHWLTDHLRGMFSDKEREPRRLHDALPTFKQWLMELMLASAVEIGQPGSSKVIALSSKIKDRSAETLLLLQSYVYDQNTQSVVLDAYHLDVDAIASSDARETAERLPRSATFPISDAVEAYWARLLLRAKERCRSYLHVETCLEHQQQTQAHCQVDPALQELLLATCRCGLGVNATDAGVAAWQALTPFATRVAISPLFQSPCIEPLAGDTEPFRQPTSGAVSGAVGGTIGACARCQKPPVQKHLLCGRCKRVTYCSKDCQTVHWPIHKQQCKRPASVAPAAPAAREPWKEVRD